MRCSVMTVLSLVGVPAFASTISNVMVILLLLPCAKLLSDVLASLRVKRSDDLQYALYRRQAVNHHLAGDLSAENGIGRLRRFERRGGRVNPR